ncbi:asparaginase [Cognatishimia sp. SS12]|uniref:asparaginase n=1 Tax=Cognatishimia sp. SS12 TaxID=2979465 RepID=UPI00232FF7FA|nr:asparaginase [Cognatishimia sp. SS12]MDC0737793.1 asparaginase [Cognatishimia sp. SS12]
MSILLIHTGGTIGMVQTPSGFSPQTGVVEQAISDLKHSGACPRDVDVHLLTPLIDSANATPAEWGRIAALIADHHAQYSGFVVTHGTDTLAYSAAALGFALQGLDKPVIVTGAMLPLSVKGSDGMRNLADAIAAAPSAPAGIWVQFAGQRLHGVRTRKSHSTEFDAFRDTPGTAPPCQPGETLRVHGFGSAKVAILAMAPGMPTDLFQHAARDCDALLLRVYGSGTAPESQGLAMALQIANRRDIPVLAVSQCAEGGMALGTYAAGAILRAHGVIDGRDMTVEAAYAKLHHVLALPVSERARLTRPLCGEYSA